MIISKQKLKEDQLKRDRDIMNRVLPVGTKVMFVNGYRPEHTCVLGRIGEVKGWCFGGTMMSIEFWVTGSMCEELVPIDQVLDHVKVQNNY